MRPAMRPESRDALLAAQMVGAAARLHRHNATPETRDKAPQRPPRHPTSQNNPARSVQTSKAARVLAKINPNDNDVHRPVPFSLKPIAILTDPGERGGPSHNQIRGNIGIPQPIRLNR